MDLNEIRTQIDLIDHDLVQLFTQRMYLSAQVADYKKEHNMPIYIPEREKEILQTVSEKSASDMTDYVRTLYSLIFELSRSYQQKCLGIDKEVV